MAQRWFSAVIFLPLCCLSLSGSAANVGHSRLNISLSYKGGYEDILLVIDPAVPETPNLISDLKVSKDCAIFNFDGCVYKRCITINPYCSTFSSLLHIFGSFLISRCIYIPCKDFRLWLSMVLRSRLCNSQWNWDQSSIASYSIVF